VKYIHAMIIGAGLMAGTAAHAASVPQTKIDSLGTLMLGPKLCRIQTGSAWIQLMFETSNQYNIPMEILGKKVERAATSWNSILRQPHHKGARAVLCDTLKQLVRRMG